VNKALVGFVALQGLLAGAASAQIATVTHEAVVLCRNELVAGGFVNHVVTIGAGDYAGFMTTPKDPMFTSPDTIVEVRSPADALIISNDDAGTDGIGGAGVGPTRGSMVRYGARTAGDYTFRVRGFSGSDAGIYGATYVRFTPGGSSDFLDEEGNDTPGTAQAMDINAGEAKLGFGSIGAGDLDYFAITVNAGDVISAFTIPLNGVGDFSAVDTRLDIRDAAGAVIITNDDAGTDGVDDAEVDPVRGSTIRYQATSSGTVYMAVRGFSGTDTGDYALTVSICPIPAPSAAALLAMGGLAITRRRR